MPKSKKKALPHITPEILAVVNEAFNTSMVPDSGSIFAGNNHTSEYICLERHSNSHVYDLSVRTGSTTYINMYMDYINGESGEDFRKRLRDAASKVIQEEIKWFEDKISQLRTYEGELFIEDKIPEVDTQQENP